MIENLGGGSGNTNNFFAKICIMMSIYEGDNQNCFHKVMAHNLYILYILKRRLLNVMYVQWFNLYTPLILIT